MARPKDDERVAALNWYALYLVRQQEEIGGKGRLAELSQALGKTELSNIKTGPKGVGFTGLLRLADALEMRPGRLLDDALSWWAQSGQRYRAAELQRRAAEAKKKTESGNRPAISRVS